MILLVWGKVEDWEDRNLLVCHNGDHNDTICLVEQFALHENDGVDEKWFSHTLKHGVSKLRNNMEKLKTLQDIDFDDDCGFGVSHVRRDTLRKEKLKKQLNSLTKPEAN